MTIPIKIKKTIAFIFLFFFFLVGLLMIYRAALKTSDLTIISGEVLGKKIEYSKSYVSGRHYYLAIRIANRQDTIAINLGTKSQVDKDSAFYLIDIGKTYKFYLDPTVPTTHGVNWGIYRVVYNDVEVYKTSNNLNLYGGSVISIASLIGMIIILKFKKKKPGS